MDRRTSVPSGPRTTVDDLVERRARDLRVVDGDDDVVATEAGLLRRAVGKDVDDERALVVGVDLDADADERAGQVLSRVLALGGGEEAGVAGIPGRLGERLDGRVRERLRVQVSRADVLGVQQVPGLSDEIEVGSVGRLLDDLAPGQRTDALEARARSEDGDDEDTAPMTTAARRSRRRTALRDGAGFGRGPSGRGRITGPAIRWA